MQDPVPGRHLYEVKMPACGTSTGLYWTVNAMFETLFQSMGQIILNITLKVRKTICLFMPGPGGKARAVLLFGTPQE